MPKLRAMIDHIEDVILLTFECMDLTPEGLQNGFIHNVCPFAASYFDTLDYARSMPLLANGHGPQGFLPDIPPLQPKGFNIFIPPIFCLYRLGEARLVAPNPLPI